MPRIITAFNPGERREGQSFRLRSPPRQGGDRVGRGCGIQQRGRGSPGAIGEEGWAARVERYCLPCTHRGERATSNPSSPADSYDTAFENRGHVHHFLDYISRLARQRERRGGETISLDNRCSIREKEGGIDRATLIISNYQVIRKESLFFKPSKNLRLTGFIIQLANTSQLAAICFSWIRIIKILLASKTCTCLYLFICP